MKAITVFCGSADRAHEEYFSVARLTGQYLAQSGIRLIYGGGKTGLMGAVADGVLQAGGQVVGVIVESMNTPALAHAGLTHFEVLPTIQQRKARMYELADGFIALPGGFGTFDELFETLTWGQIGLHQKPVGLMNIRNYFAPLMAAIQHAGKEGFVFHEHVESIYMAETAADLIKQMQKHQHPHEAVKRWMRED